MTIPVAARQRRAAQYLAVLGPAIEGSGGDDHTFRACKVGVRFDLDLEDFLPVLMEWNRTCIPPWDERKLERKCAACYRNTTVARGSAVADESRAWEPPPAQALPTYPPAREVEWLWEQAAEPLVSRGQVMTATGVVDGAVLCPSAHRWLGETLRAPDVRLGYADLGPAPHALVRGIEPGRAKMFAEQWPGWASFGERAWGVSHYRAFFPLYDQHGDLRSLRARWTDFDEFDELTGEVLREGAQAPGGVKAVPPDRYDVRGLVMANELALYLLREGHWPEDFPRESRQAWIVEGESDFLVTCARIYRSKNPLRAVFGIFMGAWTLAIAGRIPKGSLVVLATDWDAQGGKYAAAAQRTLQGRCDLRRKQWTSTDG